MASASRRRPTAPAELTCRQDEALESTVRIVGILGPTAFVLKEEEEEQEEKKQFTVYLGNPHSCSCATFGKEKDLCKHICWILLKKFKLPRDHEYALKLGLSEREINHVLQGKVTSQPKGTAQSRSSTQSNCTEELQTGCIKQKEIETEDICPICLDVLFGKMLPVTYCRFGCGSNVHIVCMKIWADYQKEEERDPLVKCPLCRGDFAPQKLISEEFQNCKKLVTAAEKQRLDRHLGIPCNSCRVYPIEGNCYKCTDCSEYHLCHACYRNTSHPSHTFVFREERNQKWRSVDQQSHLSPAEENLKQDSGENCHDEENKEMFDFVPSHVIKLLPTSLVKKHSSLLAPGVQCRLCLKIFCLGQVAKSLPCNHKFHTECIDHWLQTENRCPIDGYVVYNPVTWDDVPSKRKENLLKSQRKENLLTSQRKENPLTSQAKTKLAEQAKQELSISGTGLLSKGTEPSYGTEKCQMECKGPSELEQDLTL